MRIVILFFICSVGLAQENCNLEVSLEAKKDFNKGKRLAENFKFSESIKFLKQAIENQSDYADAYFAIARIYEAKERYDEAQKYYQKLIEICPMHSTDAYWSLANIYFYNKWFEKSKDCYVNYLKFIGLTEENRQKTQEQIKLATFLHQQYSNPVPFDPKPVKGISTGEDEYLAAFSPDNETAYFTRRTKKQEVGMLRAETVEEFTVSSKEQNYFDRGQKMPYPFNLRKNEGGPSLTIDNKEMYLTVCENEKGYKNCDIYYSFKKYENWSELERLKYPVNKPNSWESQPTISSDGKTLIFSSIRSDGVGGADLYSVTKDEKGQWTNLKSLAVNTLGNEKSPFLHPDNETLYFSSDSHLGLGKLDIFYCKKDSIGEWSKAINIGYPINSPEDDIALFVSTNGKTAYFSSNKHVGEGGWDLFEFPLYNSARPERVMFLKGEVKGEHEEMLYDAVVEVKSIKTNKVKKIEVDQETGRYVGVINVEDNEELIITVKSKDYAFNSSYVTAKNDFLEKPQSINFKMQAIEENKAFRINNIYFDSDSFELNHQTKNILNSFVEFMILNPTIELAIHGHTDNIGDFKSNQELSAKRAQEVHEYLIELGVSADRLSYEGFGELKPIFPNDSEANRAINRRTEFFILKK